MNCYFRTPGWLSWLSVRFWLGSGSRGLWVQAPNLALCWQLRAWSLPGILCLPLSLPLPCSCCLSKMNKCFKKNLKYPLYLYASPTNKRTPKLKKQYIQARAQSVEHPTLDFGSGHDLTVREFKPHIGLCADSSEPGACFWFCVPLSLCPSPAHAVSLWKVNIKKNFFCF